MLRGYYRMRYWRPVVLAVLLIAAGVSLAAEREPRSRPSRNDVQNPRPEDSRKEQLQQDAQASFPEVEKQLTQILEKVNKNQKPAAETMTQAEAAITKNKRFSLAYDDKQRADFMLLQAWVSYYQGDWPEAVNWAMRACKLDETSQDAWISQAVFSLLNDKRPLEPRMVKPSAHRRENGDMARPPRRQGGEARMSEMPAVPEVMIQKGTLDFDLAVLGNGAIKERLEQIDCQQQWCSKIDYAAGQDTLCLLFWQSEEAAPAGAEDTNDASRDVPDGVAPSMNSQKPDLESQQKYFERLFRACQDDEQVKFVQINTDSPQTAKKVAEQLQNDPLSAPTVPLVFASETDAETKDYAGLNANGPFMLVIDKDKKVKYAGPAEYFVPAFILTALTGTELDLEKISQPQEASRPEVPVPSRESDPNSPSETISRETTDIRRAPVPVAPSQPPQIPAGDPNAPDKARPQSPPEKPELPLEEQIKAENLLREGELHIEESREIRAKNPGKGIVACRKVLEQYPGTEYAEQARELLRRVPERLRERFNLTNEELGL